MLDILQYHHHLLRKTYATNKYRWRKILDLLIHSTRIQYQMFDCFNRWKFNNKMMWISEFSIDLIRYFANFELSVVQKIWRDSVPARFQERSNFWTFEQHVWWMAFSIRRQHWRVNHDNWYDSLWTKLDYPNIPDININLWQMEVNKLKISSTQI